MARIGIGDAEMARRIGVSRLTLIRWKEGVTARPRYREDVVRCAELLRLTPAETDGLLLAAGFSPETAPAVDETPPADAPRQQAGEAREAAPGRRRQRTAVLVAAAAVAAIALAAVTSSLWLPGESPQPTATPTSTPQPTATPTDLPRPSPTPTSPPRPTATPFAPAYPAAMPGESLILVAPFVNYTGGQQGFNVRGRLKSEIDRQIREANLSDVGTGEWPEEVENETQALWAAQRSGAAIVIWGEYDSGRVRAILTVPEAQSEARDQRVVDIASSPAELPATINLDLADEVRSIALLTLGQLYLEREEFDEAKTVFIQSLAQPPVDPGALASLWYRLGLAYQGGDLADLDEAIVLFTKALAVYPRSVDAYNSRGLAYLARGRDGDADRAIADLTQAMAITPQSVAAHVNRAVAYMERGRPDDLDKAIADTNRALALDPESAGALVNRAAIYIRMNAPGDLDRAFNDLERAIAIQPDMAAAYANRGNAYLQRGLPGDVERALEEYTRAIELDPDSPMAHFNRGLVYSDIGDLERSIADLRRAQELNPRDFTFNNALCWQLGVHSQPREALPYCELALQRELDGQALDSRGLVHAVMGRYPEAVEDFRAFITWTGESSKEGCEDHYGPSRLAWIEMLEAGQSPFDYESLLDLRVRPARVGSAPC